jgi:uncharacterized cupin superfamily protein
MVPEAELKQTEAGLVPAGEGWYVLNAREAAWHGNDEFGRWCHFEGDVRFEELGINVSVLAPGQPACMYHGESNQEDFLVLAGECVLLIEGEERPLRAWDFVHCPPETEHIFVGAGDGPCVIFMAGGRTGEKRITYPRSELALRYGAGAETETSVPRKAYVSFPKWQPGPPSRWDGLPWA